MSVCRDCGARIEWEELPSGKKRPRNTSDGQVHFVTCPSRPRPSYPDDVCIKCGSLSVQRGPAVGPHFGSIKCLEPECRAFRWLRKPLDEAVAS